MVGVEAVFLNLLSALVFGRLALLAFAPQEQTAEDEQGDGDYGNNDRNSCPAAGAETTTRAASALGILQLCRVGAGRASGASGHGGRFGRATRALDGRCDDNHGRLRTRSLWSRGDENGRDFGTWGRL